jgi:hypothetical protein
MRLLPPQEGKGSFGCFYLAKLTSNEPVLSCISPIALRTRPSSMIGRNIQYFLRIAASPVRVRRGL